MSESSVARIRRAGNWALTTFPKTAEGVKHATRQGVSGRQSNAFRQPSKESDSRLAGRCRQGRQSSELTWNPVRSTRKLRRHSKRLTLKCARDSEKRGDSQSEKVVSTHGTPNAVRYLHFQYPPRLPSPPPPVPNAPAPASAAPLQPPQPSPQTRPANRTRRGVTGKAGRTDRVAALRAEGHPLDRPQRHGGKRLTPSEIGRGRRNT